MLRGAASRVGPLPLRLREGAYLKRYKWAGAKLKREGGVGKRYYTGPHCSSCQGFGFSTESNCTECIQNGQWIGKWFNIEDTEIILTFEGPGCTNLVPGMCLHHVTSFHDHIQKLGLCLVP